MVVVSMSTSSGSGKFIGYNRIDAISYARKYAFDRNKKYYDFSLLGGDCTNFCSQVLYAGSKVMNYTKTFGWYYKSLNDRAPAWTGVNFFYNFLTKNNSIGPFAEQVDMKEIVTGDFIQLSFPNSQTFGHSLVVVDVLSPISPDNIFISTHTIDRYYYPLSNYKWDDIRFLHILGVRV